MMSTWDLNQVAFASVIQRQRLAFAPFGSPNIARTRCYSGGSFSVRDFLSTFSPAPEFLLRTSATIRRLGRKPHVSQGYQIDAFTIFAHHSHLGRMHATLQA